MVISFGIELSGSLSNRLPEIKLIIDIVLMNIYFIIDIYKGTVFLYITDSVTVKMVSCT